MHNLSTISLVQQRNIDRYNLRNLIKPSGCSTHNIKKADKYYNSCIFYEEKDDLIDACYPDSFHHLRTKIFIFIWISTLWSGCPVTNAFDTFRLCTSLCYGLALLQGINSKCSFNIHTIVMTMFGFINVKCLIATNTLLVKQACFIWALWYVHLR